MRYLWIAAIGAAMVSGPVGARPAPKQVPIPKEFPATMPPPAPPMPYPVPPPVLYPAIPPPPPPGYARPPSPRGNPGYWATTADYPAAALREEISGVTRFRVTVGIDGRVSECDVIQSSGSAALDATTCNLVARRARFNPAVDSSGNPAVGTYANAVRWIIPVDLPPEPGTITVSFDIGLYGYVSKCHVKSSIADDYDGWPACPVRQFEGSLRDGSGKPVARRVTITDEVTIASAPSGPVSAPPAPRQWRGNTDLPVAGTRVTEAIVETDGWVSDCRIVKVTGPMAEKFTVGSNDCPKRFERGYAAANGQSVRTLLRMTETVVIAPVAGNR